MILSLDIGTTHLKAGLCNPEGDIITVVAVPTPYDERSDGGPFIHPDKLWGEIRRLIGRLMKKCPEVPVAAVSITSMAESGLLVHRTKGEPLTGILPWFDASSLPQAQRIEREINPLEEFLHTGQRLSFKHGLSKIMWLKDRGRALFSEPAVWLSVSSFLAHKLTGEFREERTLALRTFVYRIDENRWNTPLIRHFGLHPDLFPPVITCFEPVGRATGLPGLSRRAKVYLAGHDHVVSSVAAGALSPGVVYDSMGTAETLMGVFPKRPLTERDYRSGLSFGWHPREGCYFWMGGHSSSGGSVEWIRNTLGKKPIPYEDLLEELAEAGDAPSTVLFFPFLDGSGPPINDPSLSGAFIGLTGKTTRVELLKAVLEGNAYLMEMIREEAESVSGQKIDKMIVVGGGTKNPYWLRVKANVSGCELIVPEIPEAGLAGAALLAATAEGIYPSLDAAVRQRSKAARTVRPDERLTSMYRKTYREKFLKRCRVLKQMK